MELASFFPSVARVGPFLYEGECCAVIFYLEALNLVLMIDLT